MEVRAARSAADGFVMRRRLAPVRRMEVPYGNH
jgi:hypothetical protein